MRTERPATGLRQLPDKSFGGGSASSSAIASWVEQTFSAETVGGVTVYDLTNASASS